MKQGTIRGMVVLLALFAGMLRGQSPDGTEWNRRVRVAREMGWVARHTSMSDLAPELRRAMLGGRRPMVEAGVHGGAARVSSTSAVSILDWRNQWGKNWLSPVRHQGSCGSCFVFGTVAVAEAIYRIEHAEPDVEIDFSEQLLLSCEPTGNCQDGGWSSNVLDYMREQGTAQESCFPYRALDLPCSPCVSWLDGRDRIRIFDWDWVCSGSEDRVALIQALSEGPVVVYMTVYDDFYDYGGGVYRKTPEATEEGGHIVALVGFDRDQSCWIARNSWGTRWGEQVDFRNAWGEVEMGTWAQRCWGVTTTNVAPVFGMTGSSLSVREGERLELDLQVTDANHDPVTVLAEGLPEGASLSGEGGVWRVVWTPSYTQAGSYHLVFRARDGLLESVKAVDVSVRNVKKTLRRY